MSKGEKGMSDIGLGAIIGSADPKRDAVHIAIAPVVASENLAPGQHIGLLGDDGQTVGLSNRPIGIVDPFLRTMVFQGQRFWMFLYPNTVTSLRHEWTHPAFTQQGSSETWLRGFANQAGLSYEELLDGAADYVESGDYLCQGGRWEGFETPDEFWDHYEAVKNTRVPDEKRGSFFSCSC